MSRARLTDAEREQRRRERSRHSFSDAAYRHYDPAVEGFGSWEQWAATAEELASGAGTYRRVEGARSEVRRTPDMRVLGLSAMPDDVTALKSAFRKAAFTAHPDHGGTAAEFKSLFAAYERLLEFYA